MGQVVSLVVEMLGLLVVAILLLVSGGRYCDIVRLDRFEDEVRKGGRLVRLDGRRMRRVCLLLLGEVTRTWLDWLG